MLDIFILKINRNLEKDEFDRLLSYVSEEKKERVCRFHRFEDALRTLFGDVLARYAVCKRLGTRNSDLAFGTNEYGKPILLASNKIHFNISHSGNWVVCTVDNDAVGIDVETIKPIDFKIAERFFAQDEYMALMNQPEEIKQKYFYMLWTLKESYIKMQGKGLSIPLNSFTVRIESRNISVSADNKIQELHFKQSFLDDETAYAICATSDKTNGIIHWNVEDFLKETQNI